MHSINEVLLNGERKLRPGMDLWHSLPKDHLAKFVAELLNLFRIGRRSKSFCELEEGFLLLSLQLDSFLDKLNQHAIGADSFPLCHALDLPGQFSGQSNALTNCFVVCRHSTSMHHDAVLAIPIGGICVRVDYLGMRTMTLMGMCSTVPKFGD